MSERERTRGRRLPSADWIAFGVGVAAMFLHYVWAPLLALMALAVFAPSLLRELGILRDGDEFLVGVMHRAGFHAVLAVALLVYLDQGLALLHLYPEGGGLSDASVLGAENLRKTVVWVFMVSYLIQYWGARDGSVRVLLIVAVGGLTPLASMLAHPSAFPSPGAWVGLTVGQAGLMVVLALVARRSPRAGGVMLLGGCLLFIALMARVGLDHVQAQWGTIAAMFQAILIFGATGVALLRESCGREARA